MTEQASVEPPVAAEANASAEANVTTAGGPAAVTSPPGGTQGVGGLLLKNTLFMMIAQVIGTPVSMVVNAVVARYLGPGDFGYMYLAGTLAGFGFILIDWGQAGTLPAMVARDRSRAGEFLASGLAYRAAALVVVYVLIAGGAHLVGYDPEFQVVLALVFVAAAILSATAGASDTVLGFERTDIRAVALVGQQLLVAATILPTVLLGGQLRATLVAATGGAMLTALLVWRMVLGTKLGPLRIRKETIRAHLSQGTPFMVLSLVIALQPSVDAVLLGKLGTAEAVGWHAAARKLVGALVFPAVAMTNAMYPTLCRLFSDTDAFKKTVAGALRASALLVVPVALGSALYADVGIRIFSKTTFGPAEDNLRILSVFIFLLYFSMTLGASLAAAGKQRQWAITQFACVAISAVIDPILIPYFQRRVGNGGLGVCISTVLSEVLMVGVGIWLLPRGTFDRSVVKGLGLAAVAGVAMTATARLLSGITPFVAAPISVVAYCGCLLVTGALEKDQLDKLKGAVQRRMARFRRA
jgi:O-antigen/teichoic acid export membrane protein